MHTALHALFYNIANEQYDKYLKFSREYNELTHNNQQWNFDLHTSEQNRLYFSLFREKEKNAIVSVVFLVMAIEGLINEYGFYYLGEQRFGELDKKEIKEKIVDFYFEVTGEKFPKDKQLYQNIQNLISVRNTLVHSKSIEIDVGMLMKDDDEGELQFNNYINQMIGNKRKKETKQKFLEEILRSSINVYTELKTFLQQTQ